MKFKIEPREWERKKFFGIVKSEKYIEPLTDFSVIMDYIKNEAVERYHMK